MSKEIPRNFLQEARQRLRAEWNSIQAGESQLPADVLPTKISEAISRSIDSATKTYRYVLPTQLLAKLVDADLDCRCIQVGSGLKNSFDARSVCHEVIVPFDRENHGVLGGSAEPYLNNPLRIPAI